MYNIVHRLSTTVDKIFPKKIVHKRKHIYRIKKNEQLQYFNKLIHIVQTVHKKVVHMLLVCEKAVNN